MSPETIRGGQQHHAGERCEHDAGGEGDGATCAMQTGADADGKIDHIRAGQNLAETKHGVEIAAGKHSEFFNKAMTNQR